MKKQIMIDLETLGQTPGSVIVSLGAVSFGGGQILGEFYERVDAESGVAAGLTLDPATVLWWMKQSEESRRELLQPGGKLSEVLLRFAYWVMDDDAEIWGNGASFDNVLLASAYDAVRLPQPWKYYNDRCYRTVKNLHPKITLAQTGVHHNALDDARSQALHLMEMLS